MRSIPGFVLAVAVALAASVLTGCAAPGPVDREAQLRRLMVDKLGTDAEGIRVTLVDDEAILTGTVQERATQELAKEVALNFNGVGKVDNQLEAATDDTVVSGQLANEAEDARLEIEVKRAVSGELGQHAKEVEVEVTDGAVSLRGPVPDQTRLELALGAAAKVEGIHKVVDLLTVKP